MDALICIPMDIDNSAPAIVNVLPDIGDISARTFTLGSARKRSADYLSM